MYAKLLTAEVSYADLDYLIILPINNTNVRFQPKWPLG